MFERNVDIKTGIVIQEDEICDMDCQFILNKYTGDIRDVRFGVAGKIDLVGVPILLILVQIKNIELHYEDHIDNYELNIVNEKIVATGISVNDPTYIMSFSKYGVHRIGDDLVCNGVIKKDFFLVCKILFSVTIQKYIHNQERVKILVPWYIDNNNILRGPTTHIIINNICILRKNQHLFITQGYYVCRMKSGHPHFTSQCYIKLISLDIESVELFPSSCIIRTKNKKTYFTQGSSVEEILDSNISPYPTFSPQPKSARTG